MLYEEAVTFLLSFHQNCAITTVFCEKNQKIGPGEIWTPVAGFRVLSANRYTTGPASCRLTHRDFLDRIQADRNADNVRDRCVSVKWEALTMTV